MDSQIATTACLFCGATELQPFRPYRTKTAHGVRIFENSQICECRQCGVVQAVPAPSLEALTEYYAVDYREGCCAGADVSDTTRFPKDNLFYYNRGQSIADLVRGHIDAERPRILDIGAGFGHILYAFGERYPEAERVAIEFSNVCVDHLRSLGIEVHDEAADELLPRLEREFDLVILSHVFEHLLDPKRTLELVYERLAPGGLLYIEVPNIPAERGSKWPDHVWAPRFDEPHITFFSQATLRRSLEATGFSVLACESAGPEYQFIPGWRYNMPTMRWWVQNHMPAWLFHFLRRQSVTKPMRMREREDSFYEYGGVRIWLRSISRKLRGWSQAGGGRMGPTGRTAEGSA